MQDIFQKQNDELLTNIINALCQTYLPDTAGFEKFKDNAGHIELYITPECNQKCTYCYLQKHMEDLYPKEIRNKEQILKNSEEYKKNMFKLLEKPGYIQCRFHFVP